MLKSHQELAFRRAAQSAFMWSVEDAEAALAFTHRCAGCSLSSGRFPLSMIKSMLFSHMRKTDEQTKSLAAAHVKFSLALHDAYSSIGASVKPIKLMPGSKSRRETLLKQIRRLQDKLDKQWYSDCPIFAKQLDSIYLNEGLAKKAEEAL